MCSDRRKTRRLIAARLLLCCLGVCCAGILLFQGADAVRDRAVTAARVTHREQTVSRAAPESSGKTDINLATPGELQRADGVGPALAQRICGVREERGGFRFLEELLDVPGIGEKRYEALSALFYCPTPEP